MMRTVQSVAQEMLDRYGWFVLCDNNGLPHSPGEVIAGSIRGVLPGDRVDGPVIIIGAASLDDLNLQAEMYGRPVLSKIPFHCQIYRAVAE